MLKEVICDSDFYYIYITIPSMYPQNILSVRCVLSVSVDLFREGEEDGLHNRDYFFRPQVNEAVIETPP